MKRGRGLLLAALGLALAAPQPASADPVVAAAGDIACDPGAAEFYGGEGDATHCRQKATSELLLSGVDAVLPLGDIQYHDGALSKFEQSYDPSWGRAKGVTYPAIGNHEYYSGSPFGSGYFDYFNGIGNATGRAGDRSKGYYSFDVGSWHLVALNSNCAQAGGCGPGSPQEQWLRADLGAHPTSCTLAYWHHPRFSSGGIGNDAELEPLWQALYDSGAEVVLAGHDHDYERFAPQKPTGVADASYGLREFVVGTGGKSLLAMGTLKANSQVRHNTAFGVLKLTLHAGSYEWAFVPVPGATFSDTGSQTCHGKPPPGPPSAITGDATGVTEGSATLNGWVTTGYQATTYRFQYGRTTSYGSSTPERGLGTTDGAKHPVSARLEGLKSGRTYHYRPVSKNASGTRYGGDRTFATGPAGTYASAVLATPGLASYWRLGELSGTTAYDQMSARHGDLRGAFTLAQPGALAGGSNTAVRFDGTSGEMTTGGPSLSSSGTIEGWFNWEAGTSLMRDQTTYSAGGWILAYDNAGYLAYRVAGATFKTSRTIASLRGSWHHIVLTKNGGSVALYVDGQRVHQAGGVPNTASTMPWHVMRNGAYTVYTRGVADEVAVYTSALDAATVQQHYNARNGG